ncbi:alpha-amylase family glycosyl hydrolase [Alkalitalea saponilacus]|uniref:Alpha amylase, catalytic domain n=1 Tax=Alkalitalea saponilacus TaxID=889453 RepID=A0A1T5BFR5_9BACT|nr:alpha-amylase family glycosyl hydrolase [Alkalitalea saponilacus]ASB49698.1 alpha-amylase [Alkalitalea saponilacus]SKB46142.1 Alpha amylase, catalytic domain [Alkalitalea saponilacus]
MKKIIFLFALVGLIAACGTQTQQEISKLQRPVSEVPIPDWSHNAVIYEVNVRQYTPEGTFEAFAAHLPRLKELGVDFLWFMPIHPIGEKERKGTLGSYYSIKDYKGVNPEFGTFEDFKAIVNQAHELGMKVFLDWVANHSAWDHPWVEKHPEWYDRDSLGNMFAPYDWTDVAQLDYNNHEMRAAMIDALEFWVREANIDGYRCDVAGLVPVDFWEDARMALDNIKPVYLLAEDEDETALLNKAFNSNYGWSFHHIMNAVAAGEQNVTDVVEYFENLYETYPLGTYPMHFITNHDENSWASTEFERMGDAVKTFATLTFAIEGMPLIYTGQEVGMDHMLEFFEKDEVDWSDPMNMTPFYQSLIRLKKENRALWNGKAGGEMTIIATEYPEEIFLFKREKDNNKVVALFNLSPQEIVMDASVGISGEYQEYFSKKSMTLPFESLTLNPWDYKIITINE